MNYLLFLASVVIFLAAGCNTSDSTLPHQPYSAGDTREFNAEQTASSSYNAGVDDELDEVNFSETGNIISRDEMAEEFTDKWRLIYDKPGSAAVKIKLTFDDKSKCPVGGEDFICKNLLNKNFNGDRVHVQGVRDGDAVYVKRITF